MAREKDQKSPQKADTAKSVPPALPLQPGVSSGSVDVTGIIPEGIRVDPNFTEGHPGYEESGSSEIIPTQRLAGGEEGEPGSGTD